MRFLLLLLVLALAACDGVPSDSPGTDAVSLPLLAPGLTLGTTLYGGADLSVLGEPERALLRDAVASGLGGFTLYVDWADLEPEPGRYTFDELRADLDGLEALGVVPFVNVTVVDIDEANLPPGLSDGAGGVADGVAFDDAAVIDRFGALLDRLVPEVTARGGFALGVGNEVDERFDEEMPGERDAYLRFVEAARARVQSLDPELALAVTVTNLAVRRQSRTFRGLRSAADLVAFNHAPIRPDFFVLDADEIESDFQEVLEAFGTGPVVIQELTCPSAESMGASLAWQRDCFARLLAEIERTPQVRFASVFTFQDFDAPTCALIEEALFGDELDDLPRDLAERLADYLCQLGVVAPDGTPKPGWAEITGSLSR